jgi:hypothetical protein
MRKIKLRRPSLARGCIGISLRNLRVGACDARRGTHILHAADVCAVPRGHAQPAERGLALPPVVALPLPLSGPGCPGKVGWLVQQLRFTQQLLRHHHLLTTAR